MGLLSRLRSASRTTTQDSVGSLPDEREAMRLVEWGNACETDGRLAEALASYEAALRVAPGFARAHLNHGNALLELGRPDEALEAYATAIACAPGYASAYYNLGNAYMRLGRHDQSVDAYRKAIELKPGFVDAEVALGCALEETGDYEGAVESYRRVLAVQPTFAEVHGNLGHALRCLDRTEEAIASFRNSLAIDVGYFPARKGLADALAAVGQFAEAAAHFDEALRVRPDDPETLVALGNVQVIVGRINAATESYRRVLALHPDLAGVHTGLGNAFTFLGRHEEALLCHQQALAIDPGLAEVHSNLGNTLYSLGRLAEAATSYREARRLKPEMAQSHAGLLFALCHDEAVGPDELFAEHRRFGEQFDLPPENDRLEHGNVRDPDRQLRVGFVSGDLRDHPVAYFLEPVLSYLARDSRLALHAYHNHATEDAVTLRLRAHFAHWTNTVALSDAALVARIRDDGIDVLIDLSGHTGGNRLLTFARRPAPVQASWLGYPGTTGLRAVDYYFADRRFLPLPEFAAQFTEKIVHLPAVAPFLPTPKAPEVNMLPALGSGHVTFGSFNRLSKLRPDVIALWSRLLRALPDSRLLLGGMPPDGQHEFLVEWFAREGIERDRLVFHPRCETAAYLALHHQVDLCLDAFPYTGGTTTAYALWMGVPTLSLAGRTPPGRHGATILGHVGLDAFIAHDAEEFERNALDWAGNLAGLAHIRSTLRARCAASVVQRPDLIAAGLASALRVMWRRWCAGLPPATIDAGNGAATDPEST